MSPVFQRNLQCFALAPRRTSGAAATRRGLGSGAAGVGPPPFHASRRVRDGVLRRFTAEMDPHAACRVLGVPPGASEADVKSAYRNAAMKFHPDRNAGLGADAERVAAERFRRASEAYDVLSHRGGAPGGSSSSRYASHARKPPSGGGHSDQSSQRKSGYYNGAADPFGFRYKRSDRVGDHMRRIDGNIRALYATLALVGVALYLAPQPSSPAETARRRRRADRSTHAFVERAVPSLGAGLAARLERTNPKRARVRRDTHYERHTRWHHRLQTNERKDERATRVCSTRTFRRRVRKRRDVPVRVRRRRRDARAADGATKRVRLRRRTRVRRGQDTRASSKKRSAR